MKFLFFISVLSSLFQDFNQTAYVNRLKGDAEKAIEKKEYDDAISVYHELLDSLRFEDYSARYNLSQAYYLSGKTEEAQKQYSILSDCPDMAIKSKSLSQLGVIAYAQNQASHSLEYFKNALKADPTNKKARYNYELLKTLESKNKSQAENQNQKPKEPSDFAKQIKAKADELVKENRFDDALKLMEESKRIDSSIEAYQNFIQRLHTIVEISE